LSKTCQAGISAAGSPGPRTCTIDVTATDLPSGGTLRVTDDMLSNGQSFDAQVNVIVAQAAGWTCSTPAYSAANKPFCEIATDDFAAQGNSASLLVAVSLTQDFLEGDAPQNCSKADLNGQAVGVPSCVAFPQAPKDIDPPLGGPVITLEKVATGDCGVNEAARQYTCGFDITVTNTGDAPFTGPIVLDDAFGTPKPRSVELLSGDGWSCARSDGLGTSCLNQDLTLDPGAQSILSMELILPGQVDGGQFENCIAQGQGSSDFLQATLIQTLLNARGINVGAADGAPGPRDALGLSVDAGAEPACATVNLAPIKPNCKAGQRRNSRGECYTPEVVCKAGEVKNSKGKCYTPDRSCPAGQKKNSKGQCYTPKPPKCDARTTVDTGDGCRCRYKGMRKTSAQRCVCRNTGLPSVPGIGCPTIKIDKPRETDGAAGTDQKCRIRVNGLCLK